MAGTLQADTLTHSTAGSIATNYVVEGSAKAWLYAQHRTATVEAKNSLNVSSWVDDATGRSTTNFANAMSGTDYVILVSSSYNATSGGGLAGSDEGWYVTSSQMKHDTFFGNGNFYDNDFLYNTIHGDLA